MYFLRTLGSAFLALGILTFVPQAMAGLEGSTLSTDGRNLVVELNEGKLLRLNSEADSVFIANPGIADVSVKSPNLVYLFGQQPGQTSLYALDAQENVIANVRVIVTHKSLTLDLCVEPPGSRRDDYADIDRRARSS